MKEKENKEYLDHNETNLQPAKRILKMARKGNLLMKFIRQVGLRMLSLFKEKKVTFTNRPTKNSSAKPKMNTNIRTDLRFGTFLQFGIEGLSS